MLSRSTKITETVEFDENSNVCNSDNNHLNKKMDR